ncbi:cytochrome c-type biogenesis protein CcmF [Anseongella ginsenosidimutans]|uniref:Cytochrome c-type biogenesis protein CcmF n=1 Tax=Anseongella ginsenosidimutans TaxID=496056 RepID=A0A4R3KMQ3_9SPHI|nr:cytochrome c biogenesis protein CcsA [Anseongella ginsenosidimutans]QEC52715.1 cytochrome C biogenesis protein [Anseongella ginsenosidimutans]TCS85464.1 cytochrome c-type biogenesis protein CcmF [Anseongella ginsenosidimutans]
MDIQYVGEHLFPGKLGQFFVVLAFGMALLSAIGYYFSTTRDREDDSWRKIARWAFRIHTFSVIGIGACLYFIIYNHYFEYHYAYAHSSTELPTHYIVSCFWEGQEGSFLLWAFWQAVIGNILIWKARSWEDSVMTFVALSQAFIGTMLLGVEILGYRIGSSPFILLREAIQAPIFQRADYLTFITDGNGLNPLLQNYWMVIHPPTLFAGFATMVVPFAYALAGVWTRRYSEWVKPGLPWALAAVMILGTGIIMGAFWAYEALSFGGFWAWDPVENASLLPWLIMIAAVHVMVVYKNSGHSYATALILAFLGYILVLYASFLTRSGVLGEASVHSFTDLGMSGQLVVYLLFFTALGSWLIARHWKHFPITAKEENTYSREFWLFIGTLVMIISCFQILAFTSVPVWNALFGTDVAPPTDPISTYNKWQLPIAAVVALLSGIAQYLKYKQTNPKKFFPKLWTALAVSVILAAGFIYMTEVYENLAYILLVLACTFMVVSNGEILLNAFRGKVKLAGSAVAHMGFGLMLIGALVAASKSKVISINTSGFDFGEQMDAESTRENILLLEGEPMQMGEYKVTYLNDSVSGPNTYFRVNYQRIDEETGEVKEEFDLYPYGQVNEKMQSFLANPDTRHYMLHDIYTHVSLVPAKTPEHEDHEGHTEDEEYTNVSTRTISLGDTVQALPAVIKVNGLKRDVNLKNITLEEGDIAVALDLEVQSGEEKYTASPVFMIKNNAIFDIADKIEELGLKFRFTKIIPEEDKFELVVMQKPAETGGWIVMKAIMFPYINLLWGGSILMVIGFLLSILRRVKEIKPAS